MNRPRGRTPLGFPYTFGFEPSTARYTNSPSTDDRDEMGVCLEPRRYIVGFGHFEQWVYRSAVAREGHAGARSQAGDLDVTVYGLRKWARLALQGNPTVLLLLYLPHDAVVLRTELGTELQQLAPAFASRQTGQRFLGYLEAQRQRLIGQRGQRDANRVNLVDQFGYDAKYAMHKRTGPLARSNTILTDFSQGKIDVVLARCVLHLGR